MLKPRRNPRVRQKMYTCKGGPYDGETLRLSADGHASTMTFTVDGMKGRYVQGSDPTEVCWQNVK